MSRARKSLDPLHAGDRDALDSLYRRHAGWLQLELRRRFGRVARGSIEDLVQETYVRAAGVHASGPILHPRALLLRIASRLAIDLVRAKRREALLAPPQGLDVEPASQDAGLLLKAAILDLPPRLQVVFLLSRFDGLTYPEIAQQLGLSVKTVEARMTQALQHLAAIVQP